ncbi:MAG: FAD-dependent oxidoreductase [Oscillospiraceae bacterium]|nr:FAD-dependent oxidoreductase [Oscillospiraceae bacterium]
MAASDYPHLFSPIVLGKQFFKHRIFASPQDNPQLDANKFLTRDAMAFYERKAQGGFASVCVGDYMVDSRAGHSHPFQLRGDDVRGKASMFRTAMGITKHGAVAAAELNHAGANSNMWEREGFVYGFADGLRADGVEVRAFDDAWLERLIACFADAAAYARQVGFQMITLHGGHGWCLNQFMSPRENTRRDKWGGSLENRMRFPLAVIEAVRKRIGNAMPIEIRLSGAEWVPGGYDADECVAIAKALDGKVDLLHISAGHHEDDVASMRTHPTMFLEDGCNTFYAAEVKKHVKTPVATVGALTDVRMMEELIASGKTDIVELGRQSLADPDLPLKAQTGREEDITRCMRCFTCFSNSTLGGIFYCSVNPEIGNELETMFDTPPREKKKVLVAGGGIGGMQAALTLSRRGHEVILCEKTGRLGGVLRCECNIPFKKPLENYLDLQEKRIARAGIEVRLNTAVTPELASALRPDVIVAALGSRPVKPPVKNIDAGNVVGAEEVYYNPEKAGQKCVILGGGLVGLELGVFLAGYKGREVDVIEMLPTTLASDPGGGTSERMGSVGMAAGDALVQGVALRVKLGELPNMRVHTSTRALEVTENGLLVSGPEGEYEIEADTVIYAAGQRPLREDALALRDCAPEFHMLGDCVAPKNIVAATQAAFQLARDIGR